MPPGSVDRALEYVALLFLLTLASTFAWWVAAVVARCEYRRVLSALACSMRIFFYSICLLCILVTLRTFDIGPRDPRSTLFSWIHIGGTILICLPSVWRAFRVKPPRLVVVLVIGGLLCAAAGWTAMRLSGDFRNIIENLPRYLAKG